MNGCVRYTAGEAAVRVDKAAQIFNGFQIGGSDRNIQSGCSGWELLIRERFFWGQYWLPPLYSPTHCFCVGGFSCQRRSAGEWETLKGASALRV